MATYVLRLLEDRLGPGEEVDAPAAAAERAVAYVVEGAATVTDDTGTVSLEGGQAWHGTSGAGRLAGGPDGAHVLRFELASAGAGGTLRQVVAGERAAATVQLTEAAGHLLRCDRVDFPPGGIAYLHDHRGPGIRYLLHGDLRVESDGVRVHVPRHGAWFERAAEPVIATASATQPTAFVRVMLLPAELKGSRSIRYLDPADEAKPKPQRYTMLIDDVMG